jgi:hypothetical protein
MVVPPRVELIDPVGLRLCLPVIDLVTFVGSGRECRWRFRDAGLDRRHYVIIRLNGGVYGIDLHRAQRRPDAAIGRWWSSKERFRIGALQLRWQAPDDLPATKSGDAPLHLCWERSGHTFFEPLRAQITLLGSSPWCAVRLAEPKIAPVQAVLIRLPSELVLVNLAANGALRKSGCAMEWAALEPGDRFTAGATTFRVATAWESDAEHAPVADAPGSPVAVPSG